MFNGLMVVWVSMIVFWSIPTCILTKCAINLRPKVWYNMKLKSKFHITKVNNKTSYQIWLRWFWIFDILHFLVRVPIYKCSIPLGSLHGFVHCLEISRLMQVGCIHTQLRIYVPLHVEHRFSTPNPCC